MHWRRKWQPTPVFLPGKSHGRRSLVGYSPWGHKESDTTQQLHFHFHFQPSPGAYGHYSRVNGNSKRTYTKGRLPGAAASAPHLRGKPLLTHASTGDPPTLAGRSGSIPCVVTVPFLCVLVHERYCFCHPRVESLFLPVLEVLQSNPCGLQNQIPWGFLVPLSDPQSGKTDVWLRTFTTMGELLWYYFSPVCGLPIRF